MSFNFEKTGQSKDILKEKIIIPEVSALIQKQFPHGSFDAVSMDIGTGDASSFLALQDELEEKGVYSIDRAFVDCSTGIFPDIVENTVKGGIENRRTYVCQPSRSFEFGPMLSSYEDSVDFITTQMLFHQIDNDAELSLLLCRIFLTLKEDGCLYITDFNPEYIKFLAENEPNKFIQTKSIPQERVEGVYFFDSGGSMPIVSRENSILAYLLFKNGFHITEVIQPSLEKIKDVKERYRILLENDIPMFNIFKVEKRVSNLISYTDGIVKRKKKCKNDNMEITLADGYTFEMREIEGYKEIRKGDEIVLFEVPLPNGKQICQVWIVPENEEGEIWSTNLIGRTLKN